MFLCNNILKVLIAKPDTYLPVLSLIIIIIINYYYYYLFIYFPNAYKVRHADCDGSLGGRLEPGSSGRNAAPVSNAKPNCRRGET
jgi:hypothetical protein